MRLVQGAAAVLLGFSMGMPVAGERLADPTRAFVEGYDPSGNDAGRTPHTPGQPLLLGIRTGPVQRATGDGPAGGQYRQA